MMPSALFLADKIIGFLRKNRIWPYGLLTLAKQPQTAGKEERE